MIIICVVLIGTLAILSLIKYRSPGVYEKTVALYNYEVKDNIDYKVILKPNSLYDTNSLGEDEVYLSNLVDHLETFYTYEFKGEREAEIKGSYEIVAIAEGYFGEGEKLTTLWKRRFPLVEKTSFETKDKQLSISQRVPIRLNDYSAFTRQINEATSIDTQAKLSVVMNLELYAQTDQGQIEKKSVTSLVIPLNSSYFKISKILGENKPEAIEEIQVEQRPFNKNFFIGYGLGIGILLLALFVILFGTQKAEVDLFVKELKKIFKKYGTRLVALNSEIAEGTSQINVHAIDDLVRISDELGKPIMYKHNDDYKGNLRFWVIDEDKYFIFDLKDNLECRSSLILSNTEIISDKVKSDIVISNDEIANISSESLKGDDSRVVTWENF